jgi:hypothetical protein
MWWGKWERVPRGMEAKSKGCKLTLRLQQMRRSERQLFWRMSGTASALLKVVCACLLCVRVYQRVSCGSAVGAERRCYYGMNLPRDVVSLL